MAAKGILIPVTGGQVQRGMVYFCSTTAVCLVLLVVLYLSPEATVTPFSDWKRLWSSSASPQGMKQPELEVKILEEWRLPAVADDRPHEKLDGPESFGEPRRFLPMGSAAFLFVQFGAYRYGPNTFAVVGLGAKALHKYGHAGFDCSWVSSGDSSTVKGWTKKSMPDWDLGRQYSCIVVHCTFGSAVGEDGSGGRLEIVANHGGSDHTGLPDVHWVALTEDPNKYDSSLFKAPFKYDYLYCGSPIFGSISAQRIREWIAYHVWLFGPRSHFILYDAGGLHEDVQKVLQPWIKLGFVSVMNMRQESRYDDYYYSQFLANNDCLFRAKSLANWTFYFDVEEYLYVPHPLTFEQVMLDFSKLGRMAQQVHIKQNFMSNNHCRNESLDPRVLARQWGFEKLVYRRTQHTKQWGFENRKYVIQAQYALSTGVHRSMDTLLPPGASHQQTVINEDQKLTYNHYHHTIDNHGELCEKLVDPALNLTKLDTRGEWAWHVLDLGMAELADAVRELENRTVGEQPFLP